jgi:hypothetical protein
MLPLKNWRIVLSPRSVANALSVCSSPLQTTILIELGRIEYLLSTRQGGLPRMVHLFRCLSVAPFFYSHRFSCGTEAEMRKLYMGTVSYRFESMTEVVQQLHVAFGSGKASVSVYGSSSSLDLHTT